MDQQMTFNVAEHTFTVCGADEKLLTEYRPFSVGGGDELFRLSLDQVQDNLTGDLIGDYHDDNGHTQVYHHAKGYVVKCFTPSGIDPYSVMQSNEDFTSARLDLLREKSGKLALGNSLMMLYAFASASRETLLMHSSVVVYEGRGYLFLGKSGTGKSTHSDLWLKNIPGTHLLNDDNPILRIREGSVWVYGSPWSGKRPCYLNESYPVGGIVRLWQRPHNAIRRLRPSEALGALLPTASSLPCVEQVQEGLFTTMSTVVTSVPVWSLECLPDEAAARLCHQTVTRG